eukprot:TRINITY_DN2532_c0_g1_i6.p6 TRINITY_DN2532_c0_g1~~TRINITY_DN2532_c0_g1_i6.p6  ORF type:complete len:171 (-),score=20.42 TRINITY_DN2532_c0_g1_i6:1014-1526(-)
MRLSARSTVFLEDGPIRVLRVDVPGVSLCHLRQVTAFKADLQEMPDTATRRRLWQSALRTWEAGGGRGGELLRAVPVDAEGAPVDVAVGGRAGRSVVPRGSQPRQGSADNVAVVAEAPAAANRPHAVAVGQRRLTPPLRAVPPPALCVPRRCRRRRLPATLRAGPTRRRR